MAEAGNIEVVSETMAYDSSLGVAVHTGGVILTFEKPKASTIGPKSIILAEPREGKKGVKKDAEIAQWGDDNLLPQQRVALIKKHTEMPQLLRDKAAWLMGHMVVPAKLKGFDKYLRPEWEVDVTTVPDAWKWLDSRQFKKYWRESAMDMVTFSNQFPEVIMMPGADRKKCWLGHQEATDCRLEVCDKNGRINRAFINGDWSDYKDDNTRDLPIIDARKIDDVDLVRKDRSKFNYIYLSSYPQPGDGYYQTPAHDGFFTSGWYAIAMAIPTFKQALMKNQVSAKYHIEIADEYWEKRYPGFWTKLTNEERMAKRKVELRLIDQILTGAENAGTTITTSMEMNKMSSKYEGMWRITALKGDSMDGEGIEDSREASMHLRMAMGMDPAIVGMGPGRDNASAGSGSDKWAAMKIYLSKIHPERQVLLDPLMFMFEYNGWADKGIVPLVIDPPILQTGTASELPNPTRTRE